MRFSQDESNRVTGDTVKECVETVMLDLLMLKAGRGAYCHKNIACLGAVGLSERLSGSLMRVRDRKRNAFRRTQLRRDGMMLLEAARETFCREVPHAEGRARARLQELETVCTELQSAEKAKTDRKGVSRIRL